MLNFIIRGENIALTDSLKEYLELKVSKIEKHLPDNMEANAHVNLQVYKSGQTIEIKIPTPHFVLNATETHTDLYAAIDIAADKLVRQIKKFKTKIDKKRRMSATQKQLFHLEYIDEDFDVHIDSNDDVDAVLAIDTEEEQKSTL